jgi:hypothetical protein
MDILSFLILTRAGIGRTGQSRTNGHTTCLPSIPKPCEGGMAHIGKANNRARESRMEHSLRSTPKTFSNSGRIEANSAPSLPREPPAARPGGAKPWVLASLRRFSMGGGVFSRLPRTGYLVEPLATSRGVRAHGRRDRRVPSHDHARANGRCRGPRGPNGLRAFASLRDSGHNAGASSMPLQTEDAPNVPGPTCSGDPPVSNILQSKRSPCLEAAQRLHKRPLEAGFRCTPKFALNSASQ